MRQPKFYAGLCVGGADWPYGELRDQSAGDRLTFLDEMGHREASCVYRCGGNMVRTLYSLSAVIDPAFHGALHGLAQPVYEMSMPALADRIREVWDALGRALARVEADDLDWTRLDALLGGVRRFNDEHPGTERAVSVLLCLVEFAPSLIIEAPPRQVLEWCGVTVTFEDLWHRFIKLHIAVMRQVVRRYCVGERAVVAAIEVVNEPDYHWLPDENRIERALRPDCDPLNKYVTELHLTQIPERHAVSRPFHREEIGYYREQEIDPGRFKVSEAPEVAVVDYPWGGEVRQVRRLLRGPARARIVRGARRGVARQGGRADRVRSGDQQQPRLPDPAVPGQPRRVPQL